MLDNLNYKQKIKEWRKHQINITLHIERPKMYKLYVINCMCLPEFGEVELEERSSFGRS